MKFIIAFLFSLHANAITGSAYDVMNVQTLDKSKVNFNGQKSTGLALANSVTNIDFTLIDDHLITGASLKAIGSCEDDEVRFQLVTGVTVVNTFIDWYVLSGFDKELSYPAKIPGTFKLRVAYKNTCVASTVKVLVNYYLHKILF